MREVFEFCDSRKDLCTRLIHDLFQGLRNTGIQSMKGGNSLLFGAGLIPTDMRCRDFLEQEETLHILAIEEAKGLDQLEPYLEIFRHCLVGGLMPSQLPSGEMATMVWTLHCRVLVPWGKVNVLRLSEQQFGMPTPYSLSPFRERQGMTHRLLAGASNLGARHPFDIPAAVELGSPTAAVGRTSNFVPPPSLFFGPMHAPSSPTAALYGGCFANATEQEHCSSEL
ncbi:uncharacterized protein LOC34621307 [Cyclospora cayetanensis]|nr:uncharacterized protein LOC34621307 [Cyclospora cayetanensis]